MFEIHCYSKPHDFDIKHTNTHPGSRKQARWTSLNTLGCCPPAVSSDCEADQARAGWLSLPVLSHLSLLTLLLVDTAVQCHGKGWARSRRCHPAAPAPPPAPPPCPAPPPGSPPPSPGRETISAYLLLFSLTPLRRSESLTSEAGTQTPGIKVQ